MTETLTETEYAASIDETLDSILRREKEAEDPSRIPQRTPPKKGLCRRCGQDKPINRLMLCYPCWVKTNLEDKHGWREGMPHPDSCGCALPEHGARSQGN